MRKLFFLFIALTLGIGAWAQTQTVNYIDANYQQQTVTATVITNSANTLDAGWYVVLGNDVQTNTLTCQGAVHLIVADGAKLTAHGVENCAGIQVSGGGNSLTIYGQTNQTGQLIATGGSWGAGIGGGNAQSGSNITINGAKVTATTGGAYGASIGGGGRGAGTNIIINGGTVTANGGAYGAGIGGGCENGSNITINGGTVTANAGNDSAGIGGGDRHNGSNITINGGSVTANSGRNGAGIGGGNQGSGSNIKVSADCQVFADNNNLPTTVIEHDSDTDIASALCQKCVFVEINPTLLSELREEATSSIDETIAGVTNTEILGIAQEAKDMIMNVNDRMAITKIKDSTLSELGIAIRWYNSTKTELIGELGTEQPGPAVKVTKGDTEVILYLPDKVEYIIRK